MTIAKLLARCLAAGVLGTLSWSMAAAAPPQTVYRCGPDGRVYSQTPCADGRPVTTEDPRSSSQHKAANDVAAREAQQAQKLVDERKQREASAKTQTTAGIKHQGAEDSASAPPRKAKAKVAPADSNMSPSMRVPAQATAPK